MLGEMSKKLVRLEEPSKKGKKRGLDEISDAEMDTQEKTQMSDKRLPDGIVESMGKMKIQYRDDEVRY